ncbi:MAG TPA: efflux RND transporter periplasmic adaptor subunit [Beijerinckiaceae bacterium]|jgi:multidrug efflux system membrane fusion protein
MKRFLFLVALTLAAALYAHYARWVDLGIAALPQKAETADARPAGRRGPGGGGAQPPTPVIAARVTREDVPVIAEAVGTIQPLHTVVVRAQVEGRLVEIAFREGQDVKAGDVLARIDPAAYQAQYDQAVAKKAQDEAQLANARLDLDRYVRLAQGNFGSRQQADTQRAVVTQLEAQVQLSQAAVDSAKVTLDYTTIRAPIDGRTGLRNVDAGNIVRAGDATGLVTITQLRPIGALFSLPQQQLRAINAALARGPVAVQALEADNATLIEAGVVEVVDNLVDQTTGAVRVKARFENAQTRLWPGQFVNVRAFVDVIRAATVAPAVAVQRGPNGAFVYVVGDDDRVKMTDVVVTRQDETKAVIGRGLEPGMRVVVTGFGRLTEGARVSVAMQGEAQAEPQPESQAPQQRRGRGPRG